MNYKKILLPLLLILTVDSYAEDVKISEEIISKHIMNVIKHGWSDKNATLNRELISNAKDDMDETLLQLKTPITIDKRGSKSIILKPNKYRELIAYIKFLEANHRKKEADKLYLTVVKSLKEIEAKSLIHSIFRLNLEEILIESLQEKLSGKSLNKELKDDLNRTLLVDTEFLIDAIKSSESHTINLIKEQFLSGIRNEEHKKLINLVLNYNIENIKKVTDLEIEAIESGSFSKLDNYYREKDKERELIASIALKEELKKIVDTEKRRKYLAKYISTTTSIITTSSSIDFYKKYLTHIEENRRILRNLK